MLLICCTFRTHIYGEKSQELSSLIMRAKCPKTLEIEKNYMKNGLKASVVMAVDCIVYCVYVHNLKVLRVSGPRVSN